MIYAQKPLLPTERKPWTSLLQTFTALQVISSFIIFLVNVDFYWNVAS
jgi:hypothetical protein